MSSQIQEIKDDKVLDTRGKLCPMPVIEASLVMKDLISGHVLKVLATDPGSKADFPAWAEASGHRLLKQEAKDTIFTYWIQKG